MITDNKKNNITYSLSIRNNTRYNYSGIINLVFNRKTINNEKNDNYNEEATIIYNNIVARITPYPEKKFINGDYNIILKKFNGDDNTYQKIVNDFITNFVKN